MAVRGEPSTSRAVRKLNLHVYLFGNFSVARALFRVGPFNFKKKLMGYRASRVTKYWSVRISEQYKYCYVLPLLLTIVVSSNY